MTAAIDHLVVTAATLDAGAAYIRAALGVDLDQGGEHARMGTHNRLLRLGESVYLEVLAVNPTAPPPGRPRWFGLDVLAADAPPRLVSWVARVSDIEGAAARVAGAGRIERMARGALEWRITISSDGSMPLDGVMPSLIEWDTPGHPAARVPDRGCRLVSLAGLHPQAERVREMLRDIDFAGPFTASQAAAARLVATVETPGGVRTL